MPIFRPNDYFYKHHQREGEEKWQTYARVIRDIISEEGDLTIAKKLNGDEVDFREKKEYKNLLWPPKGTNATSQKTD